MSPRMVESQVWKNEEPYVSCPDCKPENGTICGAHYIDHVERLEPAESKAELDPGDLPRKVDVAALEVLAAFSRSRAVSGRKSLSYWTEQLARYCPLLVYVLSVT